MSSPSHTRIRHLSSSEMSWGSQWPWASQKGQAEGPSWGLLLDEPCFGTQVPHHYP